MVAHDPSFDSEMRNLLRTVIDVTRAWTGTAEGVVSAVFQTLTELERGAVDIVAHASQGGAIAQLIADKGASVTTVADGDSDFAVAASLNAMIAERVNAGESVRVYSFSPVARSAISAWSAKAPGQVSYEALSPFARTGGPQHLGLSVIWDSAFMPEDDAVKALVEAIATTPTGSVPKVDVRTLLQARDHRFSKTAGGFAAAPRFVSALLNLGVSRGAVLVQGQHPKTVVSLTEAGRVLVNGGSTTAGIARQVSATSSTAPGTQSALDAAAETRSAQFVSALRTANLGPFMQVRVAVYEQIDTTIAQGSPVPLRTLVSDAVTAVRTAGTCGAPSRFPWSRARLFIESVMRRRPVALCKGEPVALDWSNGAVLVDGMADDWQLRLDGQLVLHLVDTGLDITMNDLPDLAGAIYNGRDAGETDRAFDVVAKLAEDGLIEDVAPDRPLRRREEPPPLALAPSDEATG